MNSTQSIRAALVALAVAVAPAASRAAGPFSVSGTVGGYSVSGQATFSVAGDGKSMVVTLQNTTAGGTPNGGAILTGLLWNWNGAAPTTVGTVGGVTAESLWAGSGGSWSKTGDNVDITTIVPSPGTQHAWVGLANGTVSGVPFDFGLGAIGAGTFAGTDGDDYGIVADGTVFDNSFNGKSPLVKDTVTFTLTGFEGLTPTSVAAVSLLWTSRGEVTPGEPGSPGGGAVVPEASSLMLLGFGGLPLALAGLRARRRR